MSWIYMLNMQILTLKSQRSAYGEKCLLPAWSQRDLILVFCCICFSVNFPKEEKLVKLCNVRLKQAKMTWWMFKPVHLCIYRYKKKKKITLKACVQKIVQWRVPDQWPETGTDNVLNTAGVNKRCEVSVDCITYLSSSAFLCDWKWVKRLPFLFIYEQLNC